ncbi:septal ring lytic transglycosylase RlpA family protein [Erythrobacteraceae bacterium CFH 75059]|uniref:septal ring lytic transglycosylase RlpA family protein n=1 Tax=Qipengyuania thermophila TaxID=2509361 RepID=UPI00102181A7|nr:septal ring lytic transglycosylase RlpA family protein [Qipengyuania thermophila]TCD05432.1 septal ring lytic transglycosylase RlpA family protein [Erythrobacteraceae bacterium CFH 75059]
MTRRLIRLGAFALAMSTPAAASDNADTALPTQPPVAAEADAATEAPAAPAAAPRSWAEATPAAREKREDGRLIGSGRASFYAAEFHGRRTASGARFDMHALTAAHRTLPFGSRVRVTNARNGRSVVVTINDRGPFHDSRILDVSRAAAERLAMINAGSAPVRLELLG